jgi:hypothetical protein
VVAHLDEAEGAARLEEAPARALPGEEWRDRLLAELAVARVCGARPPAAGAAVVHAASSCRIGIKTAAAPVADLVLPAVAPLEVDFLLLARVALSQPESRSKSATAPDRVLCVVTLVGWTTPRVFRERSMVRQTEGGQVRTFRRQHLWPVGSFLERLRSEGVALPRYSSCLSCRVLLWPAHLLLCGAAGCAAIHEARVEAARRG